jgi:hypothetical protein
MSTVEKNWMDLKEAAPLFGMSWESVKNAVHLDRFPCPTYKLGRRRVISLKVLNAYFAKQDEEGLKALENAKPPAPRARAPAVKGRPRGRPRLVKG